MPTSRALRLGSGVVLWVYVASHLLNHALGLVSLNAAEQGLRVALWVWHSALGTLLLYSAFAVHLVLAMLGLYQRPTLRLPAVEWLRIGAGLAIPMLLVGHAVATRMAYEWYGVVPQYQRVVTALLHTGSEGRQLALLAPGWLHGCMGLHMALRKRALYHRWRWAWAVAGLLLPCLAAAGFLQMAQEVATLSSAVDTGAKAARTASLQDLRVQILSVYGILLATVVVARGIRAFRKPRY